MRAARVALAAALLGSVAACSGPSTTQTSGGYLSGNGAITLLPPDERAPAPDIAGPSIADGERIALGDYDGQVVVVNSWGSWCPPCRAEAPALARVSRAYADDGVQLVGVAIRENATSSRAFAERVAMPYPSISDPTSSTLLGFADSLPSMAVPTTWVIDAEGRVAARVLDEVTAATLSGLIDDVLEDDGGSSGGSDG